ncbi:MAG: hypothetical protein ACPL5F_04075 [Moorellaceae bacterium]
MAEAKAGGGKKQKRLLWQSISLVLMLLSPPLLLYTGAKGNPALELIGYIVLGASMIIPLVV